MKTVSEEEGKKLIEAIRESRLPGPNTETQNNNLLHLNDRMIYITGVRLDKRVVLFEEIDDDEEITLPLGILLDQNKPENVERIVTQFIRSKEFNKWKKEIENA